MTTTYRRAIDEAVARLAPATMDEREARANVRMAVMELKSWSQVDLAIKSGEEISDFMLGKLNAVVDRLVAGEPIQYILGYADFYGMRFAVNPSVLIPRPETAELVDLIVSDAGRRPDLSVLDLCTGSGCIAVALARNLPFSRVEAVDISADALSVARTNSAALRASVSFLQADVLTMTPPAAPEFDIIVSNPPYIPESDRADMDRNVLEHEPSIALFVPDADPLRFYDAITRYASQALRPGGYLYFEINPDFSDRIVSNLRAAGYDDVCAVRDIHGRYRFVKALHS
ncbi:MAG: peptide chain release factor N(5)-glutamine methyltransferase [Paramuribaculum sp.]|nr:peptide chain release factor N(5)-glutamine methyltransferase [Paramuribaculum sp.]MDE7471302.1 peptide chain release factor N(5)-glutamine methyltransferase [Paramuribaculum sp.]